MKVIVYSSKDEDFVTHQRMEIDGKTAVRVGRPEPEDAIIGRDLISCEEIAKLMAKAHAAGRAGEPFDFAIVEDVEE